MKKHKKIQIGKKIVFTLEVKPYRQECIVVVNGTFRDAYNIFKKHAKNNGNAQSTFEYINKNEKPLAFYYFGTNEKAKEVIANTSSGGACINDTLMHIANHNLPFGGVGNSGLGKYHGKESFLAYSNRRAVISTPTWIDMPFKYPPFRYFRLIKKIL